MDITDEEKHLVGFALACYLEDAEKDLKKEERKQGKRLDLAREQIQRIEQITYTKFIPESWCGPKPSYWK